MKIPLIEFPAEMLDWDRLLPVSRPVQVEIGAGKGRFLIRAAELDPASNWVGLETRWGTLKVGVERIMKRGLENALFVRCDAMETVRLRIPPASVAAFHVYYPDPWWKERHSKRRMFTPAFVADLARALAPHGDMRVVTDVTTYFGEIVEVIERSGLFEHVALPDGAWAPGGEPLTTYEEKYLKQGRHPNRAAFRRSAMPAPPAEPWLSRKPRGRPLVALIVDPHRIAPPAKHPEV